MFEPIRGGTRGGQAEFKWSDVSADKDREVRVWSSFRLSTVTNVCLSIIELSRTQYQCSNRKMAKEQGYSLVLSRCQPRWARPTGRDSQGQGGWSWGSRCCIVLHNQSYSGYLWTHGFPLIQGICSWLKKRLVQCYGWQWYRRKRCRNSPQRRLIRPISWSWERRKT